MKQALIIQIFAGDEDKYAMLDTRPPTASMGGYGLPPPSRAESSFKHYPEDMDNGPEVINVTANATTTLLPGMGGFHLVDLIITELKDHMICYEFGCSHWLKSHSIHTEEQILYRIFFQINFPPIYNRQIYQMNTTLEG